MIGATLKEAFAWRTPYSFRLDLKPWGSQPAPLGTTRQDCGNGKKQNR